MSIRGSLIASSIFVSLLGLGAIACGGADEGGAKNEGAIVAAAPSSSAPVGSTSPVPILEPLPPIAEAVPPTPAASTDAGVATPIEGQDAEAGVPQIDPSPGCVGGEAEVEPNTAASPNLLTTKRCGVLEPGDTVDVLLVNKQAFKLAWSGFVDAQLEATAGGYLVKLTSQTPNVATPWEMHFE